MPNLRPGTTEFALTVVAILLTLGFTALAWLAITHEQRWLCVLAVLAGGLGAQLLGGTPLLRVEPVSVCFISPPLAHHIYHCNCFELVSITSRRCPARPPLLLQPSLSPHSLATRFSCY